MMAFMAPACAAAVSLRTGHSTPIALLLGTTLLASSAALADVLPSSDPGCSVDGVVKTCTGDQSAGVTATSPIETLQVSELTTGITPEEGTEGILYEAANDATLLSDSGDFQLTTINADAIVVGTSQGDVYVSHAGDISATGARAIHAHADDGAAVVEGSGTINATLDAISANARQGAAAANWTGNIISSAGGAIVLDAADGSASASGSGSIRADLDAVDLTSEGTAGNSSFNWTGDVTSDSGSAVDLHAADGGVSVSGGGTVAAAQNGFTLDAGGLDSSASLEWDGDITATEGYGADVRAADGGAYIDGSGTVHAGSYGLLVLTEASDANALIEWDGGITADKGHGALVETVNGSATLRGDATIQAHLDALTAQSDGGSAQVIWDGNVTSATGSAILATSGTGGSSVSGSGSVMAAGDAITATSSGSATATVSWAGDITSTGGRGVHVFSSAGPTDLSGSGTVQAATDGVRIENFGAQASVMDWSGDITGTGGHGAHVFSSSGPVSVSGSGNVTGGDGAFRLETGAGETVSLSWGGDLGSSGGYGVHATSAQGAVSLKTMGQITAGQGGIYAETGTSSTGNTVLIEHGGTILSDGIGVEALSPLSAVSVKVAGDMQTGAQGIHAESLGSANVTIQQTGALTAGDSGIYALSSYGAVSVAQSGALQADNVGILAGNTGGQTVFVERDGDLTATAEGISAQSSTGEVVVRMTSGEIDSGGTAIAATSGGSGTVTVEMTGAVSSDGAGIVGSNADGEVWVTMTGDVAAVGDGLKAGNTGTGEVGVTLSGVLEAGGDGVVASSATGNATASLLSGAVSAGGNGVHLAGQGNLTADIGQNTRVTGGSGFAGVLFDTGLVNTITNEGNIDNAGGVDAYAIRAEGGDIQIENHGTISGNVVLGAWNNVFNNHAGGLLESGTILDLSSGTTLTSGGTISPGGAGKVMTTALTGALETTATSMLLLDLDMGAPTDQIDLIEVSGTAALQGQVALNFLGTGPVGSYTFVTATGGVTAQDLSVSNPFVTASIGAINAGDDLQLTIEALDFAPEGLTGVAAPVAEYLERAVAAGGTGLGDLSAQILNAGTLQEAQSAYEDFTPSAYVDAVNADYQRALGFAGNMMSCALPSGPHAPVAEGSCDWTKLTYGQLTRDGATSGSQATTYTVMYGTGMQRALAESDWRVGGGFGLASSDTAHSNGEHSRSMTFHGGLSLKYAPGPFALSAALTGSWGDLTSTRYVDVGGSTQTLTGTTGTEAYNLKLRGAYVIGDDAFFLKPQLDLDTTLIRSASFTETGGSAALDVDASRDTLLSITPALEIGTNRHYQDGRVIRAFAKLGTTIYAQDGIGMTSGLASDATGVAGFTVNNANSGGQVWNLSAGFTAFTVEGWSAEAQYNWNFDSASTEHLASLKLRKTF